jgi:hypothetical protein
MWSPVREHKEYPPPGAPEEQIKVGYFDGIGLGGEKGEYIFSGALALDIMNHCVVSR